MKNNGINYFFGSSSSEGFFSFLPGLYPKKEKWHTYILKGGAGTGKSSLIKKLAFDIEQRGFEVEKIHCSSDPKSLDGAICRELKFCIVDGTKPHTVEPVYPGAVENIINLGEFWNTALLREKADEIIEKTDFNSLCHEKCARFLSAAGKVKYDTERILEGSVSEYKIHSYADRFARRRFKKTDNKNPKERKIFLSAVTPDGITFFGDTVRYLAEEIITVDGKASLVSGMLFEELKNLALKNGYDVISAFCPLSPDGLPEHIIIPSLSLAFIREHSGYSLPPAVRRIHCDRFLNTEKLAKSKNRLAFNSKVQNELLTEAVLSLKEAKRIHDETEKLYTAAMDFSGFDKIAKKIISEIL